MFDNPDFYASVSANLLFGKITANPKSEDAGFIGITQTAYFTSYAIDTKNNNNVLGYVQWLDYATRLDEKKAVRVFFGWPNMLPG